MRHINLHNIIQLQCGVWRWVYPHVGQGILMIIHFIYKINKCQVSYIPLGLPEHLPPNQSLPTLLLCALTYTSDFMGGHPPPPSLPLKKS